MKKIVCTILILTSLILVSCKDYSIRGVEKNSSLAPFLTELNNNLIYYTEETGVDEEYVEYYGEQHLWTWEEENSLIYLKTSNSICKSNLKNDIDWEYILDKKEDPIDISFNKDNLYCITSKPRIICINKDGKEVWSKDIIVEKEKKKSYRSPEAYSICSLSDGFLVTLITIIDEDYDEDLEFDEIVMEEEMALTKYDFDGNVIWENKYKLPIEFYEESCVQVFTISDNIYYSYLSYNDDDISYSHYREIVALDTIGVKKNSVKINDNNYNSNWISICNNKMYLCGLENKVIEVDEELKLTKEIPLKDERNSPIEIIPTENEIYMFSNYYGFFSHISAVKISKYDNSLNLINEEYLTGISIYNPKRIGKR